MPSSRWQRVQDALWAALEREPAAREAFLTEYCGGDSELLAEVHSLLEAHEGAGDFLGGPVPSASGSPPGGATRIRRLFQETADLTAEERTSWIEEALPHAASLRHEVAALLQVYERGLNPSTSHASPLRADPFLGRTISQYEIFEKLGEGGMGVVYRARDTRLDRVVALKFPAPRVQGDGDTKARVIREARAASALDHVNICTIHEIGETDDGQVFIAMACYAGETLEKKLERTRLPLDEVLGYAADMARGLAKAHEQGVVHRDIKPANVMVTEDAVVKLLDFGLARAADARLAGTGAVRATPAYMSPEQARGERVDHRSDIWSLGVVLYEMLTGCRPFRGGHAQAVIHGILHDEPEAVSTRRPEAPALLEQIVARALARRVADRYDDAEALLRDLRKVRDDVAAAQSAGGATAAGQAGPLELPPGGQAALDQGVDRLLRMQPGERYATAAAGEPTRGWLRRWGSRHLLPSIPVVGLAVAAAAALVAFGIGREKPPPAVPAPARTEIAVLPFQNLSAGGPHAYVAAGLHDELLTQLSKVGALTVISRTSAMAYEGTSTPSRQIAAELRVGSVLEGTVQVQDGRLRVNVQLIDAATDAHVWSNRYDRSLEDAFDVQRDLAQQIASAVGASLSRDEQLRLVEAPTPNTEAYHLYLQARAYLVAPTGDYWPRHVIAQQLLEQALALDAAFVLAHVELSLVHGRMYWGRFDATPARAARQWEAAETALQLAPHLPEAQFAMGLAHFWGRRDYERALEWFARGLGGLPNDYRLLVSAGSVHRRLGNWDQAIAALEHAARLNPRGQIDPDGVGNTLAIQRRYGEAVRAYDRYVQLTPNASAVRLWKATAYLHWEGQLDSLRAVVSHLPADRGLGGGGTGPRSIYGSCSSSVRLTACCIYWGQRTPGASRCSSQSFPLPSTPPGRTGCAETTVPRARSSIRLAHSSTPRFLEHPMIRACMRPVDSRWPVSAAATRRCKRRAGWSSQRSIVTMPTRVRSGRSSVPASWPSSAMQRRRSMRSRGCSPGPPGSACTCFGWTRCWIPSAGIRASRRCKPAPFSLSGSRPSPPARLLIQFQPGAALATISRVSSRVDRPAPRIRMSRSSPTPGLLSFRCAGFMGPPRACPSGRAVG